tara:strand:- start:447 stop:845 length:399 start_codon:yes stop_codon:yes gene_type:complete
VSEKKDYRIMFRFKGPNERSERTGSTVVKAKSKQDARNMLKGTDEFQKLFKDVDKKDSTKPKLRSTIVEETSKSKINKALEKIKRGAKGGGGGPLNIKTISGKTELYNKRLKRGGRLSDGTSFIKSLYKDKL